MYPSQGYASTTAVVEIAVLIYLKVPKISPRGSSRFPEAVFFFCKNFARTLRASGVKV